MEAGERASGNGSGYLGRYTRQPAWRLLEGG